ncbi:MAG: hypothetical protein JRJ29_22470, partial [Deltaproteobacteria bacterium]|nr:hypothetical protein [Deltaproteobacteria bacterium]
MKEKWAFLPLFLFALLSLARTGHASDYQPLVTDVTPVSFSVAWVSGVDSTGSINVFLDRDGINQASDLSLYFQPVLGVDNNVGILAATKGVLKVRVSGLSPRTSYYFQTVTELKDTGERILYPAAPPYLEVKTQDMVVRRRGSVPFSNDLIAMEAYRPGTIFPFEEGLVVVSVEGAAYPVSAFIGDGIPAPWALLDLNNLFKYEESRTLSLSGGKILSTKFLAPGGMYQGNVFRVYNSSHLGDIKEHLPIYGDFVGRYGVD